MLWNSDVQCPVKKKQAVNSDSTSLWYQSIVSACDTSDVSIPRREGKILALDSSATNKITVKPNHLLRYKNKLNVYNVLLNVLKHMYTVVQLKAVTPTLKKHRITMYKMQSFLKNYKKRFFLMSVSKQFNFCIENCTLFIKYLKNTLLKNHTCLSEKLKLIPFILNDILINYALFTPIWTLILCSHTCSPNVYKVPIHPS